MPFVVSDAGGVGEVGIDDLTLLGTLAESMAAFQRNRDAP